MKRGTTYALIGHAPLQCQTPFTAAEGAIFAVYQCEEDGKVWVRPINEFEDGRFEPLPEPPPAKPGKKRPDRFDRSDAELMATTILNDMLVQIFENDEDIERHGVRLRRIVSSRRKRVE